MVRCNVGEKPPILPDTVQATNEKKKWLINALAVSRSGPLKQHDTLALVKMFRSGMSSIALVSSSFRLNRMLGNLFSSSDIPLPKSELGMVYVFIHTYLIAA